MIGFTVVILFFSFIINAFAGFGGGLISVPLLALLYPLRIVTPFSNLLGFTANIVLVKTYYRNIRYKLLIPLMIGNLIGSVVGIHFLIISQNTILLKILGIIIIMSSVVLFLMDKKVTMKPNLVLGIFVGIVSGVLSALFSLGGPPLIIYLSSILKDKTSLRATSLSFFLVNGAVQVVLLIINGLITKQVAILFLIGLPLLVVGGWLGHRLHVKVSEQIFRRFIFITLVISGMMLLIK